VAIGICRPHYSEQSGQGPQETVRPNTKSFLLEDFRSLDDSVGRGGCPQSKAQNAWKQVVVKEQQNA